MTSRSMVIYLAKLFNLTMLPSPPVEGGSLVENYSCHSGNSTRLRPSTVYSQHIGTAREYQTRNSIIRGPRSNANFIAYLCNTHYEISLRGWIGECWVSAGCRIPRATEFQCTGSILSSSTTTSVHTIPQHTLNPSPFSSVAFPLVVVQP